MKGRIGIVATGIVGVVTLAALCVWQLQRLEWKEGVIATLEARLAADPIALPADPDPESQEFARVRVRGAFSGDAGAHGFPANAPRAGVGLSHVAAGQVETVEALQPSGDLLTLGWAVQLFEEPAVEAHRHQTFHVSGPGAIGKAVEQVRGGLSFVEPGLAPGHVEGGARLAASSGR